MNDGQVEVDVVIAGLGPTGLVLAHTLGIRGVSVLVLEREPQFYGNARAVYTDGECMRIFQSIGMADRLLSDMIEDVPVQMMLPNGSCLATIKSADRKYGWALSQFFYQPFLETALADGLSRYPNVQVLRGREVVSFAQDEAGVNVYHVESAGADYGKAVALIDERNTESNATVRARYLVGADGGRSVVRTQLGIKMQGRSFPDPWLVVDIKAKEGLEGLRHVPYFAFVCDPECPTVNCVQPKGHHRFEFMLAPGQTKEYMEDPATVRHYLSRYVDVDRFEILRKLVYTFNALVAERWRDRRVLLAGDAAHMTPQFIGQGMNAGVRDAYNLGWKLHAVLSGAASDSLLDTYETERRPHASAMIREAVRVKDYVSVSNPVVAALRNGLSRIATRMPGIGPFINQGNFIPKAVYRRGSYFGLPRRRWSGCEGALMPQPAVRAADGCRHRLDDALGDGFVLLGAGVDPRSLLSDEHRAWCDRVGVRYAVMYPWGSRPHGSVESCWSKDLIELEDVSGDWFRWLKRAGARPGCVAILRPDRFVFGVVPARRINEVMAKLREQMASPDLPAPAVLTGRAVSHVNSSMQNKEAA